MLSPGAKTVTGQLIAAILSSVTMMSEIDTLPVFPTSYSYEMMSPTPSKITSIARLLKLNSGAKTSGAMLSSAVTGT